MKFDTNKYMKLIAASSLGLIILQGEHQRQTRIHVEDNWHWLSYRESLSMESWYWFHKNASRSLTTNAVALPTIHSKQKQYATF